MVNRERLAATAMLLTRHGCRDLRALVRCDLASAVRDPLDQASVEFVTGDMAASVFVIWLHVWFVLRLIIRDLWPILFQDRLASRGNLEGNPDV